MYCTIASSISSPAIRTDLAYTTPESEITATSVVPPPMSTIMFPPGSWIGRPAPVAAGLHHPPLARAPRAAPRRHRRGADRPLLDLGDTRGHADDDPRAHERAAAVHVRDEVVQHLLGHVEVGDDTVLQRTDRDDVARGPAEHRLRLAAHGEHGGVRLVDRDDRRLVEHDALAPHVHE